MVRRNFLHRKRKLRADADSSRKPTLAALLRLVEQRVIQRFVRMAITDLQAVSLAVAELNEENPAPNPSHPACAGHAASDYCRESWQLHLAELKRRPETHWGICEHGRICAMVPITCGRRCLAVVKLAGPASIEKSEFNRALDALELLVRDFIASHGDFLQRVPGGTTIDEAPVASEPPPEATLPSPTHPQVLRALEYVSAHLFDPGLTVAGVASALDISPTYLSELFVEQTGQRMSRWIAAHRIEAARRLLATTDLQVKRIAIETGHANPNWFCHVFSVHTGMTPGAYRAAVRSRAQTPTVL